MRFSEDDSGELPPLTGDPSTFDFLTDESELNRVEFHSLLQSCDLVKNVKSEMGGDNLINLVNFPINSLCSSSFLPFSYLHRDLRKRFHQRPTKSYAVLIVSLAVVTPCTFYSCNKFLLASRNTVVSRVHEKREKCLLTVSSKRIIDGQTFEQEPTTEAIDIFRRSLIGSTYLSQPNLRDSSIL